MYNQELYHHGVKGMKWGVRRSRKQTGTANSAKRKRYSKKGKQLIDSCKAKKVRKLVSSSASVASGALRVASILMVGEVALAIGTAATVAGTVSAVNGLISAVEDINDRR